MSGGRGRLFLCGTGMRLGHMTLETFSVLKGCERIFCVNLPGELIDEVRRAFPRAEDACARFPEGRGFSDAEVSRRVFRLWSGRRDAAALMHGHPLLYSMAPHLIRRCRRRGIPYLVLPGLSSADCVLGCAASDPAVGGLDLPGAGLAVHSAPDLLVGGLALDPRVSTVVFNLFKLDGGGGWRRLAGKIGRWYPPDHPAFLVECAGGPWDGRRIRTMVAALAAMRAPRDSQTSLFLPQAKP